MSAEDAWQLKIPIRLSLSSSEITSPVDVKPAYLLAPRFAYLPALAEQCLGLFQHVLLSLPGQTAVSPWFEFQGLPLNWTQPLGVLHDLLSPCLQDAATTPGAASTRTQPAGAVISAPVSPWCLTVYYRNMPAALNNTWQNAGAAKDHYLSSLKEAGYCCRGSDGCGAVMRLPGQSQDELWAAVNRGDGATARHIMTPLKLTPTPKQGGSTVSVPVRLYIRRHKPGSGQDLMNVWEQVYSTSRPVEASQPDGSPTLLAHLMHIAMPQRFHAPVARLHSTQQQQQQQHQERQGDQQSKQSSQQGSSPPLAHQPQQCSLVQQSAGDHAAGGSQHGDDPLGASRRSGPAGSRTADQQKIRIESRGAAAGDNDAEAAAPDPAGSSAELAAAAAAAESGGKAGATGSSKSATAFSHVLPDNWPPGATPFVCGVQPDWCTPIAWLHANLRAADCFLYVVVHILGP